MDLYEELQRVVRALNDDGIAYALAGGLAVSIYATPRATEDIDLLVSAADVDRVAAAVAPLGFKSAGRPMEVAGGRLRIQRLIKIDGADLVPLDLLVPVDPSLRGLLDARRTIEADGRRLAVVTADALRTLKRLRNSTQDRADLEAMGPDA